MEHNSDNDGLLYVGKDSDLSSVYIVTKDFVQDDKRFQLKVRIVLLKEGQSYHVYLNFLKDRGCEYMNFVYIEELWLFESQKRLYSNLRVSYKDSEGKIIHEKEYENPQWIPLKNASRSGIVRKVYEVAMNQLIDKDKPNTGFKTEITGSNEKDVLNVEAGWIIRKAKAGGYAIDEFMKKVGGYSQEDIEAVLKVARGQGWEETIPIDQTPTSPDEEKEGNIDVGAIKSSPPHNPVSPVVWLLLLVAVVFVIGIGVNDYSENQKQEKLAAEQKARQERELKELGEKLKNPLLNSPTDIDTFPTERIVRRGLPNIFEYDAWKRGGEEGLRQYDQDMQRKKLDEINQRLDWQQNEQKRRLDEQNAKLNEMKYWQQQQREWDRLDRETDNLIRGLQR